MATVGHLIVKLQANTAEFGAAMQKGSRMVDGFASSVRSTVGSIGSFGALLTGGGIVAGIAALTHSAQEQIDADIKLASVLRATGGAAGFSAKELSNYAGSLQATTNYSDDAIENMMAILAMFKHIGPSVFKETTKVALDMASVLGTDLNSAALKVGKAIDNPTRGLTALSKVGVTFTDQERKKIEALQESGNLLEAQHALLSALESKFGGVSGAMANPMIQLKNALGEVAETLGMALIPFVRLLAKTLAGMTTAANASTGIIAAAGDEFGVFASSIFAAADAVQTLYVWFLKAQLAMTKFLTSRSDQGIANARWISDEELMGMKLLNEELHKKVGELESNLSEIEHGPGWGERLRANIKAMRDELTALRTKGVESIATLDTATADFTESVEKLHDKWQKMIDQSDMTDRQKEMADLASKATGKVGDPVGMDGLRKLDEQLTAIEKHAEQMKLGKTLAESLTESMQDPMDKFLEARDLLTKTGKLTAKTSEGLRQKYLKDSGLLGDPEKLMDPLDKFSQTAQKIEAALQGGMMKPAEADIAYRSALGEYMGAQKESPVAGALQQGSREAYLALAKAQTSATDPSQQVAKEVVKHTPLLAGILQAAKDLVGREVQLTEVPQ